MGRRINTVGYQATGGGGSVDGFFDKIIKYIPSDVMAAWTAAMGIISSGGASLEQNKKVLWIAFAFGVVFTAAWTWYQTNLPNQPVAIKQIIASTASFAVWAFALPKGLVEVLGWDSKYGSLLLIAWTLVLGFMPPDPTNPPPAKVPANPPPATPGP